MIKEITSLNVFSGVNSPLLPRIVSVFEFKCGNDNVWEQVNADGKTVALLSSSNGDFTLILTAETDYEELFEFLKFNSFSSIVSNLSFKNFLKNTDEKVFPVFQYKLDKFNENKKLLNELGLSSRSSDYKKVYETLFSDDSSIDFESWFYDFSKKISKNRAKAVFKEFDNKVVSVALSPSVCEENVIISGVFTLEEYRKRGFSFECINALLYSLKKDDIKNVYLWCDDALSSFYEKAGFNKITEVYISNGV